MVTQICERQGITGITRFFKELRELDYTERLGYDGLDYGP